jgi:hypothetical protein
MSKRHTYGFRHKGSSELCRSDICKDNGGRISGEISGITCTTGNPDLLGFGVCKYHWNGKKYEKFWLSDKKCGDLKWKSTQKNGERKRYTC